MNYTKYNNDILNDNVIKYISDRHNISVTEILDIIYKSSAKEYDASSGFIKLEGNEIRLIKDLINFYNKHSYE